MDSDKKTPSGDSCPVNQSARAAWLRTQAAPPSLSGPNERGDANDGASCSSSTMDQGPRQATPQPSTRKASEAGLLGTERVISSIPRAHESPHMANHERESHGSNIAASASASASTRTIEGARQGNWIYPSEQMFFDAMRRKNFEARSEDMKTIVPIHNAVNERAWTMIREWERGLGGEKCGGPRLHSFSGDSQAMTPRARFNTLLGYTAPFDRHDWVVDRCGRKIEYVIDFYSGKADAAGKAGLSFYLDVRPKLNSLEGVRMRVGRALGIL